MKRKTYLNYPDNFDRSLCNGCGTAGWKGALVPETIWGVNISEACNIHDVDYHFGQNMSDKNTADWRFYMNMLEIIDRESRWTRFLNPNRKARAWGYYQAVRKCGKSAFLAGKEGVNQ